MPHLRFAILLPLTFLFVACGDANRLGEDSIEVSGLYIMVPPAGRNVAGGGLQIKANGDAVRLVGVETRKADRVELHTHISENGVMRMRQVEGFDVADGETLALKPGGAHLMFFGVDTALAPGDALEVDLVFERQDGTRITLSEQADVRDLSQIGRGS